MFSFRRCRFESCRGYQFGEVRGLWGTVARVVGEAAAGDVFGAVQDGEEPKGEGLMLICWVFGHHYFSWQPSQYSNVVLSCRRCAEMQKVTMA